MPVANLLDVDDLDPAAWDWVLARAVEAAPARCLTGHGVALYFEKPSARTRNSTEMAVVDLGGHPVYIQGAEVGVDERETAEDVARTLGCYHRVLVIRRVSGTGSGEAKEPRSDLHLPLHLLCRVPLYDVL